MKSRIAYFAYGSNISTRQMQSRCPGAEGPYMAILPDYKLVFRGVASIEHSPGNMVPGALWYITEKHLLSLDRYEGAPYTYRRKQLQVATGDGSRNPWVYVMNSTEKAPPGAAYESIIREGYREVGLSEAKLDKAISEAVQKEDPWGRIDFHEETGHIRTIEMAEDGIWDSTDGVWSDLVFLADEVACIDSEEDLWSVQETARRIINALDKMRKE